MRKEVHQILPTFIPNDAIGNEVIEIRRTLQKWGYLSKIYAENIHSDYVGLAKSRDKLQQVSQGSVLLYHYSIGSDLTSIVRRMPNRLCIIYHNITPHQYFLGVSERVAGWLRKGRQELPSLIDKTDLALADSDFNRQELDELGFSKTGILPVLLDFSRYDAPPSPSIIRRYDDSSVNILFVGRFAPNKRLDYVLKVFGYYQKCINHKSRLFLVGSYTDTEVYHRYLVDLIKRFGLQGVHFITSHDGGPCKTPELVSYYNLADVFITMSEHEGFCIPLVECMYFKIPILAYRAAAIPEVLGGSGILIVRKECEEIGELIHVLMEDGELRNRILQRQSERLLDFERARVEQSLRTFVEQLFDENPVRQN